MTVYRTLNESEIIPALFLHFERKQLVQKVLRRSKNGWTSVDAPFIDDWSAEEYAFLCECLQNTARTGGLVLGAFSDGRLKGFSSVEPEPLGSRGQYLDLSSIHVSADMRGAGIGRRLFAEAKRWAKAHGAQKLYISSHSAVETQAFYSAMGCVDAEEPIAAHVEREPYDRQLECLL